MDYDMNSLIGKRFGHLTIIGKAHTDSPNTKRILLRCDCGCVFEEIPSRILSGHKISCGKCKFRHSQPDRSSKFKNLVGEKSGRLTVIDVLPINSERRSTVLLCECECGQTKEVLPYQFKNQSVKTCGRCNTKANVRDGRSLRHPNIYAVWQQMLARCENQTHKNYHYYGERGIKVCAEWHDYLIFEQWFLSNSNGANNLTIDRIDNDGDYAPSNCRLVTQDIQNRNTSRNVNITFNGKTQCLSDWARELNIPITAISHRYQRGWSVERMLTEPLHK